MGKSSKGRNPAQGASRVSRVPAAKPTGSSPGPKADVAKVRSQGRTLPGQQAGGPTKAAGRTASTPKPGRGVVDRASSKTGRSVFDRADSSNRKLGKA